MSSLFIFQAWTSRFPQSELPAAWEEDVRANLSKHRTKVIILSFIIVVDMVIVILVIQVNLSKHRTKVMISSRQGGNHNHCNCHPHYQSHWYRTEVFDLCFYHCLRVSVNVIITIIIINIMITNHHDHQHDGQPSWVVGITDESRRSCKKQTSPSTHRGFY